MPCKRKAETTTHNRHLGPAVIEWNRLFSPTTKKYWESRYPSATDVAPIPSTLLLDIMESQDIKLAASILTTLKRHRHVVWFVQHQPPQSAKWGAIHDKFRTYCVKCHCQVDPTALFNQPNFYNQSHRTFFYEGVYETQFTGLYCKNCKPDIIHNLPPMNELNPTEPDVVPAPPSYEDAAKPA